MTATINRSASDVNDIINAFLKRRQILVEDAPWKVRESPLGGLGIFAEHDLNPGDIIYRDYPVILGPRCLAEPTDMCVSCYSILDLSPCPKKCGLLLCSNCQASPAHREECEFLGQRISGDRSDKITSHLTNSLTPLRSLFLSLEDKAVVLYLKVSI
ncbi:unnamed protein product [Acanthoscelides obtectus]|uniref:SET domain-containing protein n=1 Tax=Acanthoscelides obtectus TaxID=200917 RepID=A0A9P0MGD0_ACAOB|nr:unnamed protein product [Acanthoscelides obtectus]CAK1677288.1 Protein msta, isoform B [Acanthoscelides obtectus]